MPPTTIKVSPRNRDALAAIARDELGGVSLDDALRVLLFQHRTMMAYERLEADPEALAEYQREARELANADIEVRD
jgi:hypothetical protein